RQFAAAADVLRRQNREEDFIKVAERLVYHDPNRPEVLRDLARMYLGRGDAKRALAKLQLCFRSQPKDVETLELLAQAFSELRQYTRTKTVYQELVQVLDDQGMVGRAEEYRLLIRQLEEADRPSPASPVPPDSAGGAPLSPAASISPADPGPDTGYNPQEYMYAAEAGNGISSSDHAMAAYGGEFDSQDVYAPEPNGAFHDSAGYDLPADAAFAAPAHPIYDAPVSDPNGPVPTPADLVNGTYVPPSDYETERGQQVSGIVAEANFDDVIIEAPVESVDLVNRAPPPPPVPEASVDKQVADLIRDAKVYQRYNLPAGALEHLQRALEIDPDSIEVLDQMRDLYLSEGDTTRGADVMAELVRVHFRNGDREDAEDAKRQIAQLVPSHPLAVSTLAEDLPHAAVDDRREDSMSFVITEDSGAFEIDVADSGMGEVFSQRADGKRMRRHQLRDLSFGVLGLFAVA
ncbi:MAG: hypothetical protein AAFV29_18790, partial [Myxococcota bacterium]